MTTASMRGASKPLHVGVTGSNAVAAAKRSNFSGSPFGGSPLEPDPAMLVPTDRLLDLPDSADNHSLGVDNGHGWLLEDEDARAINVLRAGFYLITMEVLASVPGDDTADITWMARLIIGPTADGPGGATSYLDVTGGTLRNQFSSAANMVALPGDYTVWGVSMVNNDLTDTYNLDMGVLVGIALLGTFITGD